MQDEIHYSDYLQLDKILKAQFPESEKLKQHAHDEMLFIVIHQTYELWFKQLLFEVNSVCEIMKKPSLNDNSPELQIVVHRLSRCVSILKLLVHQIDVMETMNPMDFLDFRDMLDIVKKTEQEKSLLELINEWLERMPFFNEEENWKNFVQSKDEINPHSFWSEYRKRYEESLAQVEKQNLDFFDKIFFDVGPLSSDNEQRSLSNSANRSALFIMLYRGYPILQLPYQLLNQLLEIDEQLSTWRYRHMSMVHRTIGTRIGTGGSSGKDYLQSALNKHYIFKEIAQLTSFLIERKKLPQLSKEMERRLGFVS
jgi:tryptophan 2,3-dioxygenase